MNSVLVSKEFTYLLGRGKSNECIVNSEAMISAVKNNKAGYEVLSGRDAEVYLDKDSGNTSAYLVGALKDVKLGTI